MNEKSIIFVSYYFPPSFAVGGKRIIKMKNFFKDKGYKTLVITEKPESIDEEASTAKNIFQSKEVIFTKTLRNPIKGSSPTLISLDKKLKLNKEINSRNLSSKIKSALCDSARYIRDILIFPDDKNFWIPSSVCKAINIIRKQKFKYLLTSSPPHSCHVVGLILKFFFSDLYWIADFRDPWSYHVRPGTFVANISKNLFKKILYKANMVIVTTEPMVDLFEVVADIKLSNKVLVIPNGVDIDIFDKVIPKKISDSKKIIFGHLGDLDYEHRNPEPLLKIFSNLIKCGSISKDCFEIHFWGRLGNWGSRSLSEIVQNFGLEGLVFAHGQVSYNESLMLMKSIDVLLLFAENQPLQIPAKTYEYLFAKKPVLAFVDFGSATHFLIKNFKQVYSTSKSDESGIKLFIINFLSKRFISHSIEEGSSGKDEEENLTSRLVFTYHLDRLLKELEK